MNTKRDQYNDPHAKRKAAMRDDSHAGITAVSKSDGDTSCALCHVSTERK